MVDEQVEPLAAHTRTLIRILFIGNSYTTRNDLPALLTTIAASSVAPRRLETATVAAGGASLKRHWNAPHARMLLDAAAWDYVVLQEQSTFPLKSPKRFHESVRLFDAEIKAQGAQTVLYLAWARAGAADTQDAITEAVMQIGTEIGALVAPVGPAWQLAAQECAQVPLYAKDGSHPTPAGSYLAACVFYASLYRASPVGLALPERLGLGEETGKCLQQVAARNTIIPQRGG